MSSAKVGSSLVTSVSLWRALLVLSGILAFEHSSCRPVLRVGRKVSARAYS